MHLTFDEQRVEDRAAVVDRDVTDGHDAPGLGVDFHDGDVRAERERRTRLQEIVLDREGLALFLGARRRAATT